MTSLAALDDILRLVAERTGLRVPPEQQGTARDAVRAAMRHAGFADVTLYHAALERDGAVLDALLTSLTIGETYFFRDPGQWTLLRERVIPALLRDRPATQPLRAWSAACATGEEAYTLAILLREMGVRHPARILGTDLSLARLRTARRAVYSEWSLRGVPEALRRRYFTRANSRHALIPAVRGAVEFAYGNLTEPRPDGERFDLILCRNALIYLDRDAVAQAARLLLESLAPEGWLLLGASDPYIATLADCEVEITQAGLAYRPRRAAPRAAPRRTAPPVHPAPTPRPSTTRPPEPSRAAHSARPREALAPPELTLEEVERLYRTADYAACARQAERRARRYPGEEAVWAWLVRSRANLGEVSAALAACGEALEHHPTSATLVYLRAVLLLSVGRTAPAVAALREALYLDPALAVAHALLGAALLQADDPHGAGVALRAAERALQRLDPDEPVPGSDGEPAARLLHSVRAQLRILGTRRSA